MSNFTSNSRDAFMYIEFQLSSASAVKTFKGKKKRMAGP